MKLIYQIRCVINGRVYVGQTHDLRKREADHRQKLLRGNHYSKDLQSDFDKYGLDAFVFEVLEMNIPREDLDERERSWISLRDNPYNIESGGVKNKKLDGFAGVSASHGAHRNHRKPGSVGACATPGRIFKGLRMAGRMGHETTTVQNLKVRGVDTDKGVLIIGGAIPGPKGQVVVVRTAVKGA